MSTKRILFSETTLEKLNIVTMADKKAVNARKEAAAALSALNATIDNAISVERTKAALHLDKATTAAAARTVVEARNNEIEKLETKRKEETAVIRDKLASVLAETAKDKQPIYKLVSDSMYAATMGYNHTGHIGYVGKVPVYDRKGAVSWIIADKSLVTCWKELFIALGCRKVNDLTTEREIRRFIAVTSGTRTTGAANNYKRRTMSPVQFRKECIDALIGYMVNGTHELFEEYDKQRMAKVTTVVEYAPRYTIDKDGRLLKVIATA